MKLITILRVLIPLFVLLLPILLNHFFLSSPAHLAQRFVVPIRAADEEIVNSLLEERVIKNKTGFLFASKLQGLTGVSPGAYNIPAGANAFGVAQALKTPSSLWVALSEGLRKEEIAGVLENRLEWGSFTKSNFLAAALDLCLKEIGAKEGCLFPDTYLIPVNATGADAAKILLGRFQEKFKPLVPDIIKQNIKYGTVVSIASLVQREAGSIEEMPLIAGILWNRLLIGMKLDVDATLQYIKGNEKTGWWPKVYAKDKTINSPYNTYIHSGLPEGPIANPGLDAIKAAVFPQKTNCMYYLHDRERKIHCSVSFEGHQKNIQKYIRQ